MKKHKLYLGLLLFCSLSLQALDPGMVQARSRSVPVKPVKKPPPKSPIKPPVKPVDPKLIQAANQLLVRSILSGDQAGVQKSLAQGAQVNLANPEDGFTPLMLAIYRDQPEIAKLLIVRGANLEARAPDGQTGLMMAATGGQETLITLLIERGANPNARQKDGYTALMWAAFWGHKGAVRYLAAHKADPRLHSNLGETALMLTIDGAKRTYLHTSSRARKVRPDDDYPDFIPQRYPASGDLDIIVSLVQAGAEIDAQSRDGTTALMKAVQRDYFDTVYLLLAAGANPEIRDTSGRSALDYAEAAHQTDLVQLLQDAPPVPADVDGILHSH